LNRQPYLSVIVPCYNEGLFLEKNLAEIVGFFAAKSYSWELLVVDDGSRDATPSKIRAWEARDPRVRGFSNGVNRGKGAAIRRGVENAAGEAILFFDIDLSTPLEEADRLLPFLGDHDVVIGARKHRDAVILVHQPRHREIMGKIFTVLSNGLLVKGIHDVTCGFKCFRSSSAKRIFRVQKIDRWVFDTEILFLAQTFGCRIAQVPVHWADHRDSRVSLFRDAFGSFRDLFRIKLNHWRGRYNDGTPTARSSRARE